MSSLSRFSRRLPLPSHNRVFKYIRTFIWQQTCDETVPTEYTIAMDSLIHNNKRATLTGRVSESDTKGPNIRTLAHLVAVGPG